MAFSMTGFARQETEISGETAVIEISSVNHRFLDLSLRLPSQWSILEPALRDIVKTLISRGKVYICVRHGRSLGIAPPVRLDVERAGAYIEAARELMHLMRSTDSMSLDTLIALDGVITPMEEEVDLEKVKEQLSAAIRTALLQLNEVRAKEGAALLAAIAEHLRSLDSLVCRVEKRAPELLTLYEEKLRQRIADINAEVGVKEERLSMEVAMMADRMDVTEELVRFRAHIAHAHDILASEGPVGRDLNFLVQEMQREANTLGSKLRDVEVSRDTIEIKTEIEKIREQVQNLE
ncbi:MAG: YicC family protein [Candidatus Hydrogenedentes bacterium]|nr:YicC family protein [Candidatus Hydrogenedentota bacterium]